MSDREYAKNLIDQIPEGKMFYIVSFLQGAVIPDDSPNAATLEAMAEVDSMVENGTGEHFSGSTSDFFRQLTEG